MTGILVAILKMRAPTLESESRFIWRLPQRETVLAYSWLSNTQLLYIAHVGSASEVRLLDVPTEASSLLREATAELQRLRIEGGTCSDIQLSPDHSRMLLAENREQDARLLVLDLRNASILRTPLSRSEGPTCWVVDEDGLAQFVHIKGGSIARVLDLRSTNALKIVRLPFVVGYPVTFRRRDGRFLSPLTKGDNMELSEFQVWPAPVLLSKPTIGVGQHGFAETPVFSPDGEKLAWVQSSQRRIPRLELKPWFPFVTFTRPWTRTLLVTDLRASTVRSLGISSEETGVLDVRWIPDGGSISFISGGKLFLISAGG